MKLYHHDLQIELDDTWWAEAGMKGFVPLTRAYIVDIEAVKGRELFEIEIDELRPVKRNPGVAYLVRERALKVLTGFRNMDKIAPVEVVFEAHGSKFCYELKDGTHRLYCSLAAGFTHIWAVEGFDINTLEQ
jgi:hypothetical protein